MTLVSIIIPSFRQPQFLGRAIESCLEQDHLELEIIVVEDRSRDSSLGIARSFADVDDRVLVLECSENGGLGRARNIGIAHSSGEYLCFLDSDDYLLEGSISSRMEALPAAIENYGDDVVGVYGDWQHVPEMMDYPVVRQARASMPVVRAATYTGENVFICSAPLVRSSAVRDAGGFPEGLRMLEDFALWARMIANGAIFVPVSHVVATYRQRANSMLRGDGVVVMSDHVRVINDFVTQAGTPLADGGALEAWLANETPFSYGRMSWSVPSVLGNFGGAPAANAVTGGSVPDAPVAQTGLEDFMADATRPSLDSAPSLVRVAASAGVTSDPDIVLCAGDIRSSLEAVAILDAAVASGRSIAVASDGGWESTWPLALSLELVRDPVDQAAGSALVDLREHSNAFSNIDGLAAKGVDILWPDAPTREGSVVYLPDSLLEYPALDAWISVALHGLAEMGASPQLVADPAIRRALGGYRSELFSIELIRGSTMVVTPASADTDLLSTLSAIVLFEPSNVDGLHARTADQLRRALRASRPFTGAAIATADDILAVIQHL
ncbi:MAG: teichuronic acid biosynthesis glycosyltransferase TuaG [Verrucomicrobiales bacterium]|jgi:teichuronic acid biosynthesis glycosyltransferase TuaG